MVTLPEHACRALAVAAFLLLTSPASTATGSVILPDAEIAKARALMKERRPDQALAVLRPLARSYPQRTNFRFLLGLAAIEASQMPDVADADREALLDDAIATLRKILVDQPELVRVRLELARAFFYKEEDRLARDHFERVLASRLPAPVVANVNRFLAQIRARRRWSMYLGASVAPDTNIGATSDEEIIYIFDLPFRRDNADDLTTSGIGTSVWAGGEYQHPLGNRLRLRAGADVTRREYSGSEFDETHLSVHAGPRWLMDPRTELSLLANVRWRRRAGHVYHDDTGARIEARRRLGTRVTANARVSWHQRDYRGGALQDGPVIDASLGGTWRLSPTLQANTVFGYAKERPEGLRNRNESRWLRAGLAVALPRGFNVSGSAQLRRTGFEGDWQPFTRPGEHRSDRTRSLHLLVHKRDFTFFGFSPQAVVIREIRDSTAQLHDYRRTRGELRFERQF